MIWELIKLDLRKLLAGYIGFVVLLLAYVLLRRRPLESIDPVIMAAGLLQGVYLAWRIFSDPGATQSFIFSRPFSRVRLFWNRWCLGIVLQAMTLLIVFTFVATSARSYIHRASLPFYPMVQGYELSVLWPLCLASLVAFQVQMFLMLRAGVLQAASGPRWRPVATSVALCVVALVLLGVPHRVTAGVAGAAVVPTRLGIAALCYMALLTVSTTLTSMYCYRHMEIEA